MEKEVPKGWVETTLGESFKIERGGSPRPIENYITENDNGINWIKIGDTKNVNKYIHRTKEKIKPEGLKKSRMVYEDDFILSNSMSFGRPYIMKTNGCIHDGWLVIRKNEYVDNNFLYYLLTSNLVYRQFSELAKGSTVKNLNIQAVQKVKINIPPISVQLQIGKKLDQIFSNLEIAKKGLEKIPVLLKQFRQAVLTQAVTGKLTEEWRKGKEFYKFDIIEIEKLRRELKSEFSEKQGKKAFNYKNSIDIKFGENTKGIDLIFDLPVKWQWVTLDRVTWNVSDGPHFSPKYVSENEGKRFISMRNISTKGIEFNDCKYVSLSDHSEFIKRGMPEKGDILYTKGGSTGIPCVVNDDKDFSYWVHVALIKPIRQVIDSFFLKYSLESQLCYKQSQAFTHGVGNQDLGLTRMINICFPLPPIEEQTEIVRRVEALFSKADAIEAQYKVLKEKIDDLPKAVLAKAFRGELTK